MIATYAPIVVWPGEKTPLYRRRYSPFKAPWSNTLDLMDVELGQLRAKDVVIQLYLNPDKIRLDGMPRSDAYPSEPGVIVNFDSKYGPLQYATDTFTDYQANMRAIALGLEALRKVDRYGITKRGEQYTGWKALPAGGTTLAEAREFLSEWGGGSVAEMLKRAHPDYGGTAETLRRALAARKTLQDAGVA